MVRYEILILTYNQENLIANAIRSAANQSHNPSVIRVFDDCSTDNTYQIAQNEANKYHVPIEVHRNEQNLGVFKNFNQMIASSNGDITSVLAGDDELELDFIENIDNYIKQNNVDLSKPVWLLPSVTEVYDNKEEKKCYYGNYDEDKAFELILTGNVRSFEVGLSLSALRMSSIKEGIGYQADNLKSWLLAKKAQIIFLPFYAYRYSFGVGVTNKSKTHDLYVSRKKCLELFNADETISISKRERILIKYEEAKINKYLHPNIKNYVSLFNTTVQIVCLKNNPYGFKRLLLPFFSPLFVNLVHKYIHYS